MLVSVACGDDLPIWGGFPLCPYGVGWTAGIGKTWTGRMGSDVPDMARDWDAMPAASSVSVVDRFDVLFVVNVPAYLR